MPNRLACRRPIAPSASRCHPALRDLHVPRGRFLRLFLIGIEQHNLRRVLEDIEYPVRTDPELLQLTTELPQGDPPGLPAMLGDPRQGDGDDGLVGSRQALDIGRHAPVPAGRGVIAVRVVGVGDGLEANGLQGLATVDRGIPV